MPRSHGSSEYPYTASLFQIDSYETVYDLARLPWPEIKQRVYLYGEHFKQEWKLRY